MADNNEAQNQKDYQDYLDYQKYVQAAGGGSRDPSGADVTMGQRSPIASGIGKLLGAAGVDTNGPVGNAVLGNDIAPTPKPGTPDEMAQYKKNFPGAVVGAAGSILAPESKLAQLGIGAVTGAAQPADSWGERGLHAAEGAGVAGIGMGIGGVARKAADWGMQKAVGMRKYLPGVGNSLVKEGIVGTKNGMASQVDNILPQAEQSVQDIAHSIQGTAPSSSIADQVSQVGNKFKLANGEVPPNVQPYMSKVRDAAEGVGQLGGGQMSAPDLVKLKRQGDWLGYTASGNPATSLEAELGQAQADAARGSLAKMSDGAMPDALKREQALILGRNALNKPESIHQGLGAAAMFGKIPGSSLVGSLGAQASQKLGGSLGDLLKDPSAINALLQSLEDEQKSTQK